jgi:hypothetical protein
LALGKGIRERTAEGKSGSELIMWGGIMGVTPILFDWFFLIREGMIIWGLVGPALLIAAVIFGWVVWNGDLSRRNEKSIAAILMGGTAFSLGLILAPYLIQQAQTRDDIDIVDYVCSGAIPLMFIVIGASFVWNGSSAILKHMTFDELIAERQKETGVEPEEEE